MISSDPKRSRYMVYIYSRRLFYSDHIWTMYLQIIMVKASWPFSTGSRDWYYLNKARVLPGILRPTVRKISKWNKNKIWICFPNPIVAVQLVRFVDRTQLYITIFWSIERSSTSNCLRWKKGILFKYRVSYNSLICKWTFLSNLWCDRLWLITYNSHAIDNNVIARLGTYWETPRTYCSRVLYLQMAMFKLYGDLRKGEISCTCILYLNENYALN